jgi:ubiquinone/menaquinone biosynthesis C-methylase UbiE
MATNKREIRDSYDNLGGKLYDLRYDEEQREKYETILNEVEVSEHEIILDNGCGTGLLLEYLSATTIALDISSSLLSMALSRIQDVCDKHLIQGDAENLPLRDNVFSRIFAITLIQNTPNTASALEEMFRVGYRYSLVAVTTLKKAFSEEDFRHIIESVGFVIMNIINDEKISDIIAILSLKTF